MKRNWKSKYRENMTDEQKQKRIDYQKECVENITDEQKQKYKDYRREYYKKYYEAKKLNNKIIDDNDNDNKIIDDNDNDFYYISIILKFLNEF